MLKRKDPDESTWDEIIGSKDPTVFTIFLEDSAGLAPETTTCVVTAVPLLFQT
jgi:hypothetical protein